MAAQHLERFHQAAHGFFFLFAAVQFADVGAAFDHFFVADIDRHEGDRFARVAQEAAHRHRQHAGTRLQHAAAAAAAAFHEILNGEALGGDAVQVFVEHRRVQRVVAEAAAHEESAAPAQDGAHHRQVQVDAGGDVRRHQAIAVDHERQQQIVDVAAVAGHVNDFVVAGHLGEVVQVIQADAVIEAVPQPVEKQLQRADGGVRIVRRDLHRVAARPRQGFVLAFLVLFGGVLDRLAHRRGFHDRVGERPPVGQVRADGGFLLAAEVHAQNPRRLAHHLVVGAALVDQLAQRHGRAELHVKVATLGQHDEEFLDKARRRPVVGEDNPPQGILFFRLAAPEHRHRHQLHIQFRVVLEAGHQPLQSRRGDRPALTADGGFPLVEVEVTARQMLLAQGQRRLGGAQPEPARRLVGHRRVRQGAVAQHIHHRYVRVQLQFGGVAGQRADTRAQTHKSANQQEKESIKS